MAETVDKEKLIKQIAKEVIKRLNAEVPRTLAVFPGYVFDVEGIAKYLETKVNVTCVLMGNAEFDSPGFAKKRIETAVDKKRLAAELKEYSEVILVTPPLSLLNVMTGGDDSVYEAMLALRPLLWEKDVRVLLDFAAPKFKRSAAFMQICDTINTLEAMGIKVENIICKKAQENEKDLITEQDIKEAVKNGTLRVRAAKGAIVTQLAEDAASELGVVIKR